MNSKNLTNKFIRTALEEIGTPEKKIYNLKYNRIYEGFKNLERVNMTDLYNFKINSKSLKNL